MYRYWFVSQHLIILNFLTGLILLLLHFVCKYIHLQEKQLFVNKPLHNHIFISYKIKFNCLFENHYFIYIAFNFKIMLVLY